MLIREMKAAAENLEYERAASIRDRILEIKGSDRSGSELRRK